MEVSDSGSYSSGNFCLATLSRLYFPPALGLNGKQEIMSSSPHNSITKLSEHSHISGSNDSTPFPPPHGSAVTLTFLVNAHVEIAWQAQVPSCGTQFPDSVWFLGG